MTVFDLHERRQSCIHQCFWQANIGAAPDAFYFFNSWSLDALACRIQSSLSAFHRHAGTQNSCNIAALKPHLLIVLLNISHDAALLIFWKCSGVWSRCLDMQLTVQPGRNQQGSAWLAGEWRADVAPPCVWLRFRMLSCT